MTKIIFVDYLGNEQVVDATIGESVMETAIKNGVDGIDADCGGACSCATCHIYMDPDYSDRAGEPSEMEASMLEFAENVKSNSRLSCQIEVTPVLDGLKVVTPETQQ